MFHLQRDNSLLQDRLRESQDNNKHLDAQTQELLSTKAHLEVCQQNLFCNNGSIRFRVRNKCLKAICCWLKGTLQGLKFFEENTMPNYWSCSRQKISWRYRYCTIMLAFLTTHWCVPFAASKTKLSRETRPTQAG